MSTEIKPGQVWAWNADIDADESAFRILDMVGNRARYEYVSESDPHVEGGFFHTVDTLTEKAHLATPAPATCAHGQTAEDLCNQMPDKVELDAMWTAWKSLTPAEQRGWLEGGEGKVPTPAKIQLATALMPLHDAPDIENVPAASSMHALMGAVAEIQHGVRQIVESMSPEATAERARVIAPLAMELARELEEPEQVHEDTPPELRGLFTPAPLDPSKVKAGDTVTLTVNPDDHHPAFTVAGETHSLGGSTVYLGGWRVDDLPDYVILVDHQPAPKPDPATFGTATVEGVRRPGFTYLAGVAGHEGGGFISFLYPEGDTYFATSQFTDFVPGVLINTASVDVNALAKTVRKAADASPHIWYMPEIVRAVLAELGIEAP